MTTNPPRLSKRVAESLALRNQTRQWEKLIGELLRRLELPFAAKQDAEAEYMELGNDIAAKLGLARTEVNVYAQGSMRTQTTISPRYPSKFDIDVVVELLGPRYRNPHAELMFHEFGLSLRGNEAVTGAPEARRRCWRLPYPNKPYYFDVTPAVIDDVRATGAALKVRDPDTGWTPSNPKEFADWFCERADLRFHFQRLVHKNAIEARSTVTPLPDEDIGIDDILRRTLQLLKLHRDNMYWFEKEEISDARPISVILLTLATHAYENLYRYRAHEFTSPIEVVLAIVEDMPLHIVAGPSGPEVRNPLLPSENFADRWQHDGGLRQREFYRWHKRVEEDLDYLLHQDSEDATEDRIRSVFGNAGVEAWKASKPKASVFGGLLATAPGQPKANPSAPLNTGSKRTLG